MRCVSVPLSHNGHNRVNVFNCVWSYLVKVLWTLGSRRRARRLYDYFVSPSEKCIKIAIVSKTGKWLLLTFNLSFRYKFNIKWIHYSLRIINKMYNENADYSLICYTCTPVCVMKRGICPLLRGWLEYE